MITGMKGLKNMVAVRNHARVVITRNIKDYEGREPQPVTPEEFLKQLDSCE